jgi:hypothetical protein
MTTETMQAGRELDALVAEKVMGWREVRLRPSNSSRRSGPDYKGYKPDVVARRRETPCHVPAYSTDIAAAWEVVEAMERRGCLVVTRTRGAISGKPRVEITGTHPVGRNEWLVHEDADTVPLAICRAALAALEAV